MKRVFLTLLLVIMTLGGCIPKLDVPKTEEDGDTGELVDTTSCSDFDGDGYEDIACGGMDCDDANAAVNPRVAEICDGFDNDCDAAVDEGVTTVFYRDADGDGYGDGHYFVTMCVGSDAPTGYAANATDCDDADALVNPGAVEACTDLVDLNCDGIVIGVDIDTDGFAACEDCDDSDPEANPTAVEVCNGIDDNCDGEVDEATAADATVWYADTDGDSYGNSSATVVACEAPSGYVENSDDCDDGDIATYPDAYEDCKGEEDTNCDGSIGGEDADLDGYNSCWECDDGDAAVNPDATEICNGIDDNCDGEVDDGSVCDSGSDTGSDTGGSSGGTFVEITFGDGGICSADPFTDGAGGAITSTMIFSDGAGTCGVHVYGGGSSAAPSGTQELLYEASGFTEAVVYTAELEFENTLSTDLDVFARFGGGVIGSVTVGASSTGDLSISWTADASGAASLEVWSSTGTNYDVVLHGVVIAY